MAGKSIHDEFAWFENFVNFERISPNMDEYKLDRMAKMLEHFGNPQLSIPCIHIAGSKGKGSIAHHIAIMAKTMGLRSGVYASPHIDDYRERIYTGDAFFEDSLYLDAIQQIKAFIAQPIIRSWGLGQPTCFELLTLCAFLVFKNAHLDLMIIETGLGGRLDATNLVEADVCVISLLELEHTDVLGPRIEDIAREKAGIFKRNAAILSASQTMSAQEVLDEKAAKFGTKIDYLVPEYLDTVIDENKSIFIQAKIKVDDSLPAIILSFQASFQAQNFLLASRALFLLLRKMHKNDSLTDFEYLKLSAENLWRVALESAQKTKLAGRLELIKSESATYILDASHTAHSVAAAITYAQNINRQQSGRLFILFSLALGKNIEEIKVLLAKSGARIMVTSTGNFKKSDPEALYTTIAHAIENKDTIELNPDQEQACLQICSSLQKNDTLLVCGSFYLLGAVRTLIQKRSAINVA